MLAIAHAALGHPGLFTFQVRLLFALARHRPDCLEALVGPLLNALDIFPGEFQKELDAWPIATGATSAGPALRQLKDAVAVRQRLLDTRRPLLSSQHYVRPLPTSKIWHSDA
ncbi:MAG: hypothetical protein R3F43_31100 [bacterium]